MTTNTPAVFVRLSSRCLLPCLQGVTIHPACISQEALLILVSLLSITKLRVVAKMPVLETVAGIIAIIQISERVIKACKFYLDAAAGTPSDLQAILVEVSTLKAVLETLQFLQSCPHSVPALWDQLLGQDGPLELCEHLILDLEGIFPNEAMTVAGSLSRSKRPKVQLLRTSLAWPLKAGRARKLLQTITQQKMTIILALSADSR